MIGNRRSSLLLAVIAVALASPAARAQTPSPAVAAVPPTAPPPAEIPLRLALQVEAANGVVTGSFHNQLLGVRLDGRFSPHLALGGYVGFADLKGKDGRAHSALTYALVEYLAGDPAATVRYPLRFASGYLAANGPVVRLSGGLAIAVGKTVDLIGEIAPMVWLTNNQTLLSLGASLELSFRL
jgi:hypothetical protein